MGQATIKSTSLKEILSPEWKIHKGDCTRKLIKECTRKLIKESKLLIP